MDRLLEIDHEDAMLSTFILFVQTAQAVLKYADAYLYRKTRLSVSKLIVLQALASSGAMMPSKITEWTTTKRHNITALANTLIRDTISSSHFLVKNTLDRVLILQICVLI